MMRSAVVVLFIFVGVVRPVTSAPMPAPEPGPRLSDAEFFAMLDLSRADLAEVKRSVERSDWAGARHALAEHMRTRPSPHWEIDPRAVGHNANYSDPGAEKAMKHLLSSQGIEWQFGETIDWAFNPTTQPDSKWPRNNEWTWQLNRHEQWLALAKAYYATGDEKYAQEFVAELNSWVHDCPVPLAEIQNKPFSRWRTIEAGIRAGTVWPEIFPRVLSAKSFDDAAVVLMLKSFVDHAEYLMKFHMTGNWLTMEANGLYHVGALFPEFKDAQLWRDTAAARLDHELDAQVYPDGAQIELTPGYHGLALRNFSGPVELISMTGFQLPKDYLPKLERMFSYLLFSMQPDRRTPPLNDSGAYNIEVGMRPGARYFPQREDFRWVATNGKEGKPPKETSHVFPYAGQFIMRSGWDADARWLCMDGGPFGYGHQHEDKLSVILTAYGQPLLVEGGTYIYDASEWRKYVLSSRAHNVVMVDSLEQARRHEPKETYVVKDPLPQVWESNEVFDHAASRYDEGWGPESLHPITQTRHVFFLKPDVFIIADELESMDGKPHHCEALFHLNAPDAAVDGLRVTTQNDGPNLTVMAYGADGVKIVKGQKEPVVQGWLPDSSAGYGGIKAIPTAIFSKTVEKKATVLYVLYPTAKAAACPVTQVKRVRDTLTVRFNNGTVKTVKFRAFPKV
jgi:Heparinase II/III N-terminus/Heparinase II/III-like protein